MVANSETIYLIGTGFTKAVFHEAPLNRDLLKSVVNSGGKKLAEYQESYKTDDIEKLLTQLDLDALEHEQAKSDRHLIEAELSAFFTRFRFSEFSGSLPTWLEMFSLDILKDKDSIISLNYDCLLEGMLDYYGVWSPNDGYARVINYLSDSITPNPKKIKIYKIHGSENFVESSAIGKDPSQTAIGYIINGDLYPKSGANSFFGGGAKDPRPYIIAPSYVKIPHVDISAMMLDVLDIAKTARNFIVIGCSMRPEDSFLWLLLTRFLNKIREYRKRLIILSPSSETIWKRISRYWVGDICEHTDVLVIPCGIEEGIQTVSAVLNDKAINNKRPNTRCT